MNLDLNLDHKSHMPLYRQVYEQIREKILLGLLRPGTRLPASRKIAREYSLARVTITSAYEQLKAEGYVFSRVGAGTYVTEELRVTHREAEDTKTVFAPVLSPWGERVMTIGDSETNPNGVRLAIDFGFGRSFPHIFPYDIWRRLLARYLSIDDTMLSRYGSVAGFNPLREAVADYLIRMRGVNCTPDQVIIVSGMQQALDILARLLLNQGDEVLVETPGYAGAFDLFRTFGAKLIGLPVDDAGFPVETIPIGSQARFAFVTPSNQFPKGGAMPLYRRLALLRWARKVKALVLEDDYDGELRYSEHPLAALQGLDKDGRVVYLGTFSKVLFPALRLGYVVVPPSLLPPFIQAMQLVDRGAPTLTQAAVADFITEGHFERHLRRLRKVYGERRQTLLKAINEYMPDLVKHTDTDAGLHVMLYLPAVFREADVIERAKAAGVGVYPGAPYHLQRPAPPSILLGFSGLSREEIIEGVARLATVI